MDKMISIKNLNKIYKTGAVEVHALKDVNLDISKGQMVAPFSLWCFDESRQPGDTGIVKSTYGYHVMYYVGQNDPYWRLLADANKTNETYNEWMTATSEKYPQQVHGFAMRFTK